MGVGSLGQRTVRVNSLRPGLRRVTLRTEMDNTQLSMAIILVDIKLLTMEDIKKKDMLLNNDIEVTPLKIIVLF